MPVINKPYPPHTRNKERLIVASAIFIIALFLYALSDRTKTFTWSDAEGYYLYLPALTIYGGFDFKPITTAQFPRIEATGNIYDKYTFGVALMQTPFYLVSSLYAAISPNFEFDGYSTPYQLGVLWAAIFYVFFGLYILYFLLRSHVGPKIATVVLFCLFFGTNLMHYTYSEPGMSHAYSFFLWCAALALTRNIYKSPSWGNFLILGVVCSLMVFIRPTNALVALMIFFWDMPSLRQRFEFVLRNFAKFILLIIPFGILVIAQLNLWKTMLGTSIMYSYLHEPGFIYFASPKIGKVLFSVQNGVFIYSPILILPFVGLIQGLFRKKQNLVLISIILAIGIYIFSSWWAWWFGGAYGYRPLVDFLPLLSWPFAYLIVKAQAMQNKWLLGLLIIFSAISVYYSIGMTSVYTPPWDGPNFGWQEWWAFVRKGPFLGL